MFHGLPLRALVINQSRILLDPYMLFYILCYIIYIHSVFFKAQKEYWPYVLVYIEPMCIEAHLEAHV